MVMVMIMNEIEILWLYGFLSVRFCGFGGLGRFIMEI